MKRSCVLALLVLGSACILDNPDFDGNSSSASTLSEGSAASLTLGSESESTSVGPTGTSSSSATESGPTESGPTESGPTEGTSTSTSTTLTSTSDDTSTGSTTAVDPGECGNGMIEGNEECDGGENCSAMCHLKPTGIALEGMTETELVGNGPLGNTAQCADNLAFDRIGGMQEDMDNDFRVCKITVYCAELILNPDLSVDTPNAAAIGSINGMCNNAALFNRPCDNGEVFVGVSGKESGFVSRLQFRCAPIKVNETADGFVISTGTVKALEPFGSDDGDDFGPFDCAPGSVVTGAEANINASLVGLQLPCAALVLTYD